MSPRTSFSCLFFSFALYWIPPHNDSLQNSLPYRVRFPDSTAVHLYRFYCLSPLTLRIYSPNYSTTTLARGRFMSSAQRAVKAGAHCRCQPISKRLKHPKSMFLSSCVSFSSSSFHRITAKMHGIASRMTFRSRHERDSQLDRSVLHQVPSPPSISLVSMSSSCKDPPNPHNLQNTLLYRVSHPGSTRRHLYRIYF